MKVRPLAISLVLASVALATSASAEATRPSWCPRQGEAMLPVRAGGFEALAGKAQRKEPITVVAIGSSSTEGSDLADRNQAYPTHLKAALEGLLGAPVTMLNRGRGGEDIPQTVARFEADLVAAKPDLVVWQLGGNDIMKLANPAATAKAVSDGFAKLAGVDAPVVLMDSQAAPRIMGSEAREPIDAVIKAAGRLHGALFWSRYEAMLAIKATGAVGTNDLIRADGVHMTVPMHVCTGQLLAEAIVGAVRADRLTARR